MDGVCPFMGHPPPAMNVFQFCYFSLNSLHGAFWSLRSSLPWALFFSGWTEEQKWAGRRNQGHTGLPFCRGLPLHRPVGQAFLSAVVTTQQRKKALKITTMEGCLRGTSRSSRAPFKVQPLECWVPWSGVCLPELYVPVQTGQFPEWSLYLAQPSLPPRSDTFRKTNRTPTNITHTVRRSCSEPIPEQRKHHLCII